MNLGEEVDIASETVIFSMITFSMFIEPTVSIGLLSAVIANQGAKKLYEREKKKIKSKEVFAHEKKEINNLLKKEKRKEHIHKNNKKVKEINNLIKQYEKGDLRLKRKIETMLYDFEKELKEE